jgi:hypothetical protein
MARAIWAGGGVGLPGVFAGFLWFLSLGPPSPGQLTIDQAGTVCIAALFGGIGSLFFARRLPPALPWITTIVGWILGFFGFPALIDVALTIFASSK